MHRSLVDSPPGLNLRNNIRQNDKSLTPLQFVYEAADCRLFWTQDMLTNITRTWEKSAMVRFGNRWDLCVQGSYMHPTSVSGGGARSVDFGPAPGKGVKRTYLKTLRRYLGLYH
jgi:hypothetical protein